VFGYLLWRSRKQPEYKGHWGERVGIYRGKFGSRKPVIWVHAVSVGETRAAQPLIEGLVSAYPDHRILLTNGTPTGRAANSQLYGGLGVSRCYLPYDHPWCVKRFLKFFRPRIGVLMEAELWPSLIYAAHRYRIPMALVNARLSEKSLAKGQRWPALIEPAVSQLTLVQAQTVRDADRIKQLGRTEVFVTGNMKFDVSVSTPMIATGQRWRQRFDNTSIVLLASSRDGEEQRVLEQWCALRPDDAILMIVPRHPNRFEDVAQLMAGTGLRVSRRADLEREEALSTDLILGDSMGEMASYYGAANVCIMGGSLLPFGGQNLIEACACSVPVVVGMNTYNFEEAAESAIDSNAAMRVDGPEQAVNAALEILRDNAQQSEMAENAKQFASAHRGATNAALRALGELIDASRPV
jgi:3-deoxy-D-manno-octulosonic-acid transferase